MNIIQKMFYQVELYLLGMKKTTCQGQNRSYAFNLITKFIVGKYAIFTLRSREAGVEDEN